MDGFGSASCVFDDIRKYRYTWWRCLATRDTPVADIKPVCFIMLNPSTADEKATDPTVRKCMSYATRWGYDMLRIVNLFALRSPKPSALKRVTLEEAIGPDNDRWLLQETHHCAQVGGLVVAAWGQEGLLHGRAMQVRALMEQRRIPLHALQLNQEGTGEPSHPLYLPLELRPFLMDCAT